MYKELKELLNRLYENGSNKSLKYLHVVIEDLNTNDININRAILDINKYVVDKYEKEIALEVCDLLLRVSNSKRKMLLINYFKRKGA